MSSMSKVRMVYGTHKMDLRILEMMLKQEDALKDEFMIGKVNCAVFSKFMVI